MLATMIDRLILQSYVLDMCGESYRLAITKRKKHVASFLGSVE